MDFVPQNMEDIFVTSLLSRSEMRPYFSALLSSISHSSKAALRVSLLNVVAEDFQPSFNRQLNTSAEMRI